MTIFVVIFDSQKIANSTPQTQQTKMFLVLAESSKCLEHNPCKCCEYHPVIKQCGRLPLPTMLSPKLSLYQPCHVTWPYVRPVFQVDPGIIVVRIDFRNDVISRERDVISDAWADPQKTSTKNFIEFMSAGIKMCSVTLELFCLGQLAIQC